MNVKIDNKGLYIGILIVLLWIIGLAIGWNIQLNWSNPFVYLLFLLQTHLFTGLFITAHDAMHGTVSPQKKLNDGLGKLCTFLYAFFPYHKLYAKHHHHHQHVGTEKDPDHSEGNFIIWYFKFIKEYISIWQIIGYALSYNLFKLFIPYENLIFFWIAPALLSTLQLFFFGTYMPHKGEHDNQHQSKSQQKNHLWAFVSCYFFGYHYEHHDKPFVPWWQLYKHKL